jgi:flagellar motility protein MotE (MotC chaperone)
MTAKQLIFILLTLTLLFLAVISISVWLYKFKPEFLAFKPRVIVIDTNAVEKIDTLALKLDSTIKVVQIVSSERDSAQMTIKMRNDSISFVNKRLDSALNAARTNERLKEDAERNSGLRIDSLAEANFLTFAKIYDDSAPPNVAAILKNIDDREAAKILKLMKRKNAARVLESMDPERAAVMLSLGALTMR